IADIAETANVAGTVADTVTGQWSSQYQKEGRASDDNLASARGRAAAGATATAALAYYASPRQPSDQTTFRTAVFSAVKNHWRPARRRPTPSASCTTPTARPPSARRSSRSTRRPGGSPSPRRRDCTTATRSSTTTPATSACRASPTATPTTSSQITAIPILFL